MSSRIQRFSAPAPVGAHPAYEAAEGLSRRELDADHALNELCVAWAAWCRTRRFYGPPPLPGSTIGKLCLVSTGKPQTGGPDASCGAELAALHLAVVAQPANELGRQVFELHYLWRIRNVKAASAELGISRQHWYRLLRDFRRRVHRAAGAILQANLDALRALPSQDRVVAQEADTRAAIQS
jgi:hypothetical protein